MTCAQLAGYDRLHGRDKSVTNALDLPPPPLMLACTSRAPAGLLLRNEKDASRAPHAPLQLPQLEARAAASGVRATCGSVGELLPSLQKLKEVAASAAADEAREGVNETSHVDVFMCAGAVLTLHTATGSCIGVRVRDIVSVSYSTDTAIAAATCAIAAFIPLLQQAPPTAAAVGGCGHSQPCTCNWYDLHVQRHRPSIWRAMQTWAEQERVHAPATGGRGGGDGEGQPDDFEGVGSCSPSDVMEMLGDNVAAVLASAVARCCSCLHTLVHRQRWRAIRKKIWRGRRDATAADAAAAAAADAEAAAALAKLHPAAAAAVKKAAARAAAAAAAASVKAAAAAAAACIKDDNSCAESPDESARFFGWHDEAGAAAADNTSGSSDDEHLANNARVQKAVSRVSNGVGTQALESLKQRFISLPQTPVVAEQRGNPAHFSLAAAAAHLQQRPDLANAIKQRAERMGDIHRRMKLEKERDGSPRYAGEQEKERKQAKAAVAAAAEASSPLPTKPSPAPAPPLPPRPHAPRLPALRLDPFLHCATAALEFFACVQDVRSLVSDASFFAARHVRAYHRVWAPWESQRLVELQLLPALRLRVPSLPPAGVGAAAAAAAAVLAWPWWMPRLDCNLSAFVHRTIAGALPETLELPPDSRAMDATPKGSRKQKSPSPKKGGKGAAKSPTAATVAKVVTAENLALEATEQVLQLPLRHDLRQMLVDSVLEHGATLAASAAADEQARAAAAAASRAPPMQKEALDAAAAVAQEDASNLQARLETIQLPPLLQFACSGSKLHSLLSLRDGRAIEQASVQGAHAASLADLQVESLRALMHPELAASPHLAPFSFCENSTDPSWFGEAPVSWILAMSGSMSGEQLQCLGQEFAAQWGKFATEALQSPIPSKIGLSGIPSPLSWDRRLVMLREAHGASAIPKPDALTVPFAAAAA